MDSPVVHCTSQERCSYIHFPRKLRLQRHVATSIIRVPSQHHQFSFHYPYIIYYHFHTKTASWGHLNDDYNTEHTQVATSHVTNTLHCSNNYKHTHFTWWRRHHRLRISMKTSPQVAYLGETPSHVISMKRPPQIVYMNETDITSCSFRCKFDHLLFISMKMNDTRRLNSRWKRHYKLSISMKTLSQLAYLDENISTSWLSRWNTKRKRHDKLTFSVNT